MYTNVVYSICTLLSSTLNLLSPPAQNKNAHAQAVYFLSSSTNYQSYVVKNTQILFTCSLLTQCDASQNTRYYAYSIADMQQILNTSSVKVHLWAVFISDMFPITPCVQFYSISSTSIPGYDPVKTANGSIQPIQVILTQYAKAQINPSNDSYIIDTTYRTSKADFPPLN